MIERRNFKHSILRLTPQKTVDAAIEILVDVLDTDGPIKGYVNGVKIEGELSFELPFYEKPTIETGFATNLVVLPGTNESGSSFNILITEKTLEVDVIPKKLKRHYWSFRPIGNPIYDRLEIFPVQYKNPSRNNRVYWWNEYGKFLMVVAPNKEEARKIIREKKLSISPDYCLYELDTTIPDARLFEES